MYLKRWAGIPFPLSAGFSTCGAAPLNKALSYSCCRFALYLLQLRSKAGCHADILMLLPTDYILCCVELLLIIILNISL